MYSIKIKALGLGCCLFFLIPSVSLKTVFADTKLETDVSFDLETWFFYDDNVYLTTRRGEEADLVNPNIHELGKSDYFARMIGTLSLDYSLVNSDETILQGCVSYGFLGNYYSTEDTENMFQQKIFADLELLPDNPLSIRFFAGYQWEERRKWVSYGLRDHQQYHFGFETKYEPNKDNVLRFSYERGYRDYSGTNRLTPVVYHDYYWHRVTGRYTRKLSSTWEAEVLAAYRWRDYSQEARGGTGALINGRDREDRFREAGGQLTGALTSRTAVRFGYLFSENLSTGSFYRYDRHRVYGLVLQQLTPKTDLYVYLHKQWKPYEAQLAYRDPLGARTPRGTRHDREWLALLGVEQKLTSRTSVAVEYSRVSNHSNDDSSNFHGSQYSAGILWHF